MWLAPLVLAGAGAGLAVSLLLPRDYVSDTEIVLVEGNRPAGPGSASRSTTAAIRELARSRTVAMNVIDALHLRTSPDALIGRIDVKAPQPGLLRIAVHDSNGGRARQIASQVGLVFPALVQARFGGQGTAGLRAAVWDAAGEARRPGAHWLLGGLAGALAGALAGLAAIAGVRRPGGPVPAPVAPDSAYPRDQKLVERESDLVAREAELDTRAAELTDAKSRALHEQAADVDDVERARTDLAGEREQLGRRAAEVEQRVREVAQRDERLAELDRDLASRGAQLESLRAEVDGLGRAVTERGMALDRREAEAQQVEAQRRRDEEALRARAHEVEEKARWVEARAAELGEAERRNGALLAQLAAHERELEAWEADRTARERGLAPAPSTHSAPPAPPPEPYAPPPPPVPPLPPPEPEPEPFVLSTWSLPELERLVEQHAAASPSRVEEWRYYLLYLRDFAGPGGELPPSFDSLVHEAFSELTGEERFSVKPS